jgi:hypothetical protein
VLIQGSVPHGPLARCMVVPQVRLVVELIAPLCCVGKPKPRGPLARHMVVPHVRLVVELIAPLCCFRGLCRMALWHVAWWCLRCV